MFHVGENIIFCPIRHRPLLDKKGSNKNMLMLGKRVPSIVLFHVDEEI